MLLRMQPEDKMSWLWVGPCQETATPTTILAGLTSLSAALKRFEPKKAANKSMCDVPHQLEPFFSELPTTKPQDILDHPSTLIPDIPVMQRIVTSMQP